MTDLPLEILRLISQYLLGQNLLQFQLVNKQWHEASSESLYSHVSFKNDSAAQSYIRTISNFPRFGSYLKTISANRVFSTFDDSILWDRNNLMATLVKYCFNLRSIETYHTQPKLWIRLVLAASHGQLPNLQRLPEVRDENIESYVCTALAFRKSLNRLHLVDHVSEYRRENYKMNIGFFQELLDHIKEFPNIKYLSIIHCTKQPFSHIVDSIIDDCPHLIELSVALFQSDLPGSINQNVLAIPKPNIRKLSTIWMRIYKDNELKYVMRKFPNLQHLILERDFLLDSNDQERQAYETSYDVMMEFIKYISSIKTLDLTFACKRQDMINYWDEFCKLRKTEASKNISICYTVSANDSVVSAEYTEEWLSITYVINSTSDVIPHEEFLCEHGNGIKELTIGYTSNSYKKLNNTSAMRYQLSNENWIYQILQSCPNLQELKFVNLLELKLPGISTYQHTELNKLKITDEKEITSLKFLKNLSYHVPNLKELEIYSYHKIDDKKGYCIEIDMPYTAFDIIQVKFEQTVDDIEEYYMKLNTFVDESYYFINAIERRKLTYNVFQKSKKRCLFEITCRSLKEFELLRFDTEGGGEIYSTLTF